ncbi:hypothetical protein BD324DRAFT_294787 [Kockovaella imperatae]|uniref:Uncharacterized protein n=1 Tax=Kockovaella imperatae TaxID=4999 RepID=A0A1Y1ULE4_9TREE|nr:hypothetical protein BD324DRAFT_294787 [Kockovaella imperatae]ORX38868.1 hypothetical protein BD324DRAFT_294787 [Kockovaella imperatae]
MISAISEWTASELPPAMRAVGYLILAALDEVPLPFLVIGFVALLAMLQWSFPRSSPHLPFYSPSAIEKGRLSPLPCTPPSLYPSQRASFNACSPIFYPSFENGKPQYIAVIHDSSSRVISESGTLSPPRSGGASRRGSKQNWRTKLGVVDESPEEKFEV